MRCLITSALPYINGIKHLGNLAGSLLPADVHARFRRMIGDDVVFLCATDEHGTPAELAALEQKTSPQEYCDTQYQEQLKTYQGFNLSFDWFGRTSSPYNHQLTQDLCAALEQKGFITEITTEQIYSLTDQRFLPDRYVEGTCPFCGYTKARGDQCDGCTSLLDPKQLLDPYSTLSGSRDVELRETKHLFLNQNLIQDQLEQWVDDAVQWPPLARSIAKKWLKEGIKPRSITRDLQWGVPVANGGNPRPGFEHKVFYVWFDAPIGYISATQEWAHHHQKSWQAFWLKSQGALDTEYIQFMGKDNVAFHTISFPATLMGADADWKLVDKIKAFNWVNWYGEKFSTSQKRGVFLDQALDLLPADYWRWYLTANAPESSDTSFTWETFQAICNADLCNNLGNFINRIVQYCWSKYDGVIPPINPQYITEVEEKLMATLNEALATLTEHHHAIDIRKAAATTKLIWSIGNEYLAKSAPWTVIKTDPEKAATITAIALNIAALCAILSFPFMPQTAEKILRILGVSSDILRWPATPIDFSKNPFGIAGALQKGEILFQKLEDDWIAHHQTSFKGIHTQGENIHA